MRDGPRLLYEEVELLLLRGRLPREHPLRLLFERARVDPFVRAALATWRTGRLTYEEAVTELALQLSAERERLLETATRALEATSPAIVVKLADEGG